MNRRHFLTTGALASVAALAPGAASSTEAPEPVGAVLAQFTALPGTASCLVAYESTDTQWQISNRPNDVLFVGSAVKTFILAEILRAAERGQLAESDPWTIDDTVRSLNSPVFMNLSGTTQARSVLEAMIAHSDNTATDVALAKIGPDRVRKLIADAGLTQTRIPDSTRRLFSYIAGAAEEDLGWSSVQQMQKGGLPGTPRPP